MLKVIGEAVVQDIVGGNDYFKIPFTNEYVVIYGDVNERELGAAILNGAIEGAASGGVRGAVIGGVVGGVTNAIEQVTDFDYQIVHGGSGTYQPDGPTAVPAFTW